jgi:hypothetical protein
MRILTETDYRQESELALRKIFINDNPRDPCFGSNAEVRKLIYEYHPPEYKLVSAIMQCASKLSEQSFYISILTRSSSSNTEEPFHWSVPLSEVSTYLSVNTDIFRFAYQLENVIYSPNGLWGIVGTFENFGILAGKSEIINEVVSVVPEIDQQVYDFLSHIITCVREWGMEGVNIGWLPNLMNQIYGKEASLRMLKESGISNLIDISSLLS